MKYLQIRDVFDSWRNDWVLTSVPRESEKKCLESSNNKERQQLLVNIRIINSSNSKLCLFHPLGVWLGRAYMLIWMIACRNLFEYINRGLLVLCFTVNLVQWMAKGWPFLAWPVFIKSAKCTKGYENIQVRKGCCIMLHNLCSVYTIKGSNFLKK